MAWFHLPFQDSTESLQHHVDWLERSPKSHWPSVQSMAPAQRCIERQRPGQQLLRQRSFQTPCAQDELTLEVSMPTPEEAQALKPQVENLTSDMHDMEILLLEQFVEKDYGDDLLMLVATDRISGRLVGMIFWRYLRSTDDEYWQQVNIDWEAAWGPAAKQALVSGRPFCDSWVLIELLCTDSKYRGHGVGKLLLVAALAYSAVKHKKTAAVLTVARGDENRAARELYEKLGFEQMPAQVFAPPSVDSSSPCTVDPRHVLVIWDIDRSLRSLSLGDILAANKGTVLPQFSGSRALTARESTDDEIKRLGSRECKEIVDRLTGFRTDALWLAMHLFTFIRASKFMRNVRLFEYALGSFNSVCLLTDD